MKISTLFFAGFLLACLCVEDVHGGELYSWGGNHRGQLGNGTTLASPLPVQVTTSAIASHIAIGHEHSLAILDDGTAIGWGLGLAIGYGGGSQQNTPVQVVGNDMSFMSIAAGYRHSLAVMEDGTVRAWGWNTDGQLGPNANSQYGEREPFPVPGISNAVSVAAGNYFSLTLLSDGTVSSWGENSRGQLGDGLGFNRSTPKTILHGVTAIAAGSYHALALLSNGQVRAWGANDYGQLGDGTNTDRYIARTVSGLTDVVAVSAGNHHSLALLADGTVKIWGNYEPGVTYNVPQTVVGLDNIVVIEAGYAQSFAISADGRLWAWGPSGDSLGLGDSLAHLVPEEVMAPEGYRFDSVAADASGFHALAILSPIPAPGSTLFIGVGAVLVLRRKR